MAEQKLIEYIQNAISQGKSKEEVYKTLLNEGWKVDDIAAGYGYFERQKKQEKEKVDTQKRTIRIIVTIGAILIGAGIFSFIASNWQEIPKAIRVAIILIAMVTAYAGGWYMKEKSDLKRTGGALLLLGSIIYGGGIFLVAQIFNIRANWPDGFILWMFGTLAMAYALELNSLFLLAVILGLVAIIGHPVGIMGGFSGRDPFLLTSSFLLILSTIVTFITGYLIHKKIPPEVKNIY